MEIIFYIILISIGLLILLRTKNKTGAKIFRRIIWGVGIGVPLLLIILVIAVVFSPEEDIFSCDRSRPNLGTCFTVKVGSSVYDPSTTEEGYVKGGTYFKIGDNEPYSGCAIYKYDYFDGHSGSMCFEDGKPHGIWSYWKNEYNELEKDVCYIKGKKQRNLSECD